MIAQNKPTRARNSDVPLSLSSQPAPLPRSLHSEGFQHCAALLPRCSSSHLFKSREPHAPSFQPPFFSPYIPHVLSLSASFAFPHTTFSSARPPLSDQLNSRSCATQSCSLLLLSSAWLFSAKLSLVALSQPLRPAPTLQPSPQKSSPSVEAKGSVSTTPSKTTCSSSATPLTFAS